MDNMAINTLAFLRKFRRNRKLLFVTSIGCILLSLYVASQIGLFSKPPPAWRSSSQEAGLLRVMRYIEREGEVDGIVRDAFVDRVWKSVKMDLFRDLVYKSRLGSAEEKNGKDLKEFNDYDFFLENSDVLKYVLSQEGQNKNGARSPLKMNDMNSSQINLSISSYFNNSPITKDQLNRFLSNPILNNFEFSYKIDQSKTCINSTVDIIIAVPSAPGNFERRQKVRKSERAMFAQNPQNRAKLLFFLGSPDPSLGDVSRSIQSNIDEEQNLHGDIVQATFVDSYKNISRKAAQLLHWSSVHCREGKFLIRTDDDVTVDINRMVKAMEDQNSKVDNFIIGTMRVDWKPHRKRSSKYFISFEDLPHKSHPPFLLGGAMGYPIKSAGLLLQAMKRISLIWLDDFFLTAMCAKRVGVPIFNSSAFQFVHE